MIQWVAFDLHAGYSIASLPGLIVDYPIARTIGRYETASAHLIIDGNEPINWLDATLPGRALLACYEDDDPTMTILWTGYVNTRTRNSETDTIDLGLVTTEGYLDRRFVGEDRTFTNIGQNSIVQSLIEDHVADAGSSYVGLPLTVSYTEPGNDGTQITQVYRDADNTTVYEAVSTIAALDGGPEWTIEWFWNDDYSGIHAIFYIGDRIGTPAPTSGSPAATFEMPGALISAVLTEDYSSDKGANAVMAYSSTSGVSPSPWQVSDTAGRPRFEFRFEPQTSNTMTTERLTSHATRALRQMKNGARAVALTADRATAPQFGVTWRVGDDVGYVIGGLADDGTDSVPAFPGGLIGIERCLGVQLALDTISPIAEVAS